MCTTVAQFGTKEACFLRLGLTFDPLVHSHKRQMVFDAQSIITVEWRDPSTGCNQKQQEIPMVRIVCDEKITAAKSASVFFSISVAFCQVFILLPFVRGGPNRPFEERC